MEIGIENDTACENGKLPVPAHFLLKPCTHCGSLHTRASLDRANLRVMLRCADCPETIIIASKRSIEDALERAVHYWNLRPNIIKPPYSFPQFEQDQMAARLEHIFQVLEDTRGNVREAARRLGMPRTTLIYRLMSSGRWLTRNCKPTHRTRKQKENLRGQNQTTT